ncbi:hypothetical protein [Castellaniella sp.]|uniref:hypothetical protein n=1 Tax=Castellaniella sp. TaxID=1955812 RepID=UPI003A8DD1E3
MDTDRTTDETADMDTTLKNEITDLLAQARDITRDVLGEAPPAVVAEVFRQMCIGLGDAQEVNDWPAPSGPHAMH